MYHRKFRLSRTFSNSFELLMIAARFDQFLSRSELIYSSTSSSVCQELFSRFFNRFLGFHPICPRSSERSHILSSGFGFVNPFFHYFSFFFIFPIICVNIGITPQNVAAPTTHTAIGSRCVRKLTPKASRQKIPSFFSPHPAPRQAPAVRAAAHTSSVSSDTNPSSCAVDSSSSKRCMTDRTDRLFVSV